MKNSIKLVAVFLTSFFFLVGCSNNDDKTQDSEFDSKASSSSKMTTEARGSGALSQTFPNAQQEVIETFQAIAQSVRDGDIDTLISFHAYSDRFTEFKNGEPRNGAEANEAYERGVFGSVTEIVKFDALDMQVAVYYANVANLTFHSDFHLKFGEDSVIVKDQISLLFAKINGEWKIVAEHHSPLNQ